MKRSFVQVLFLLLSFFILLSGFSFPQIENSSQKTSVNSADTGSWSLQTELIGYNNFSSNLGLSLAATKFISGKSALQGGIEFLGLLRSSTNNISVNGIIPQVYSIQRYDLKSKGTQVVIKYLYYPLSKKEISIYTGGGPLVCYYVDRVVRSGLTFTGIENQSYLVMGIGYTWAAGLLLSTGIEWAAYDNLAIVAEYGIAGVYAWTKVTTTHYNREAPYTVSHFSDKSFSIMPAVIKIGCSVYL